VVLALLSSLAALKLDIVGRADLDPSQLGSSHNAVNGSELSSNFLTGGTWKIKFMLFWVWSNPSMNVYIFILYVHTYR
jgi:hypothetical protein